jgi:mycolipenoyl-CoA---2-(long-chain-fatty acyl)-trehalose mycolipenoyltransferase / long-chain-acyl-CoA---trehalose acyltransferase
VIVFFPDNPVARESVTRYVETLKSVFVRIAESRGTAAPIPEGAQFQRQLV